jgi:hypothetical protein
MSARGLVRLLPLVLAAAAATGLAQEAPPKPPRKIERKPAVPADQPGAAPTAAPTPAPELAQLGYFLGAWRCEGNAPATPMGPAHKTRSAVTIRPDFNGFWHTGTVREERTPDNPHPIYGMFHQTYDTGKKQFLLLWVDNYGGWATETTRGWDGDRIVYEGEGTVGGQTLGGRDTFVKKREAQMTHTAEIMINGQWITASQETCRRAPAVR